MHNKIVGSILHGAYGDVYEQALCLKHYSISHPEVELLLFAASTTRLESFRAVDLSFAQSFSHWTEIENHPEIEEFFQFQVTDGELQNDVIKKLPQGFQDKLNAGGKRLPWDYMRDFRLIPPPESMGLKLSRAGREQLASVLRGNRVSPEIWEKPTVSFLWRYRRGAGAISSFGQKSQEQLVESYSTMFQKLIERHDCHVLVCGMNVITDETNRARTDNKYPAFGLNLPSDRVTYMQGLSWPIELEIASWTTASCGHASGFTEGLWLRRGGDVVLMDAPPHYLAKAAYHRMPLFDLNRPGSLLEAAFNRNSDHYKQRVEAMVKNGMVMEPSRRAA